MQVAGMEKRKVQYSLAPELPCIKAYSEKLGIESRLP